MFDIIYNAAKKATSKAHLKQLLLAQKIQVNEKINYFYHERKFFDSNFKKKEFPYPTPAGLLVLEGLHDKVNWLRELGADADEIARMYAFTGNEYALDRYEQTYCAYASYVAEGDYSRLTKDTYPSCAKKVAEGYVWGKHHERVMSSCFYKNIDVSVIINAYNETSQHDRASIYAEAQEKYLPAQQKFAYPFKRNDPKVVQFELTVLLKSYLLDRSSMVDGNNVTKTYLHYSIFSYFQKSYTQKKAAVEALLEAIDGKDIDLTPHLSTLRNGKLGNQLRYYVKGNGDRLFEEFKSIHSIRDFVKALQEKIKAHKGMQIQ